MNHPPNVLLAGTVGSTAYGMATETSDIDTLGVYAAPTTQLHGLTPPTPSVTHTQPDWTYHEAGKAARLLLGVNPTVTELLWLPDTLYTQRTDLGAQLIAIRAAFLTGHRIRSAYLGYATSQFKRLENRGDGSFSSDTRKRTAKHARHLIRLCHQGIHLYRDGHLNVTASPEQRTRYFELGDLIADGNLHLAQQVIADTEQAFDSATGSHPDKPNLKAVEEWLQEVRRRHWENQP